MDAVNGDPGFGLGYVYGIGKLTTINYCIVCGLEIGIRGTFVEAFRFRQSGT